ncbi:hypothetical protein PIB30_063537 [Stylosanthes scabra]|uniref:Uncharacterized protein n=1 Tax=Stylosanthes scabra TaxID=79078 RepID=A0ABU6RLL3_9FABA|nr:hypothetical protein [Stylosanthes scabra]
MLFKLKPSTLIFLHSPPCPFLFAHCCRCYLFSLSTVDCRYFVVIASSVFMVATGIIVVASSAFLSIASSMLISVPMAYAPSLYHDCVAQFYYISVPIAFPSNIVCNRNTTKI